MSTTLSAATDVCVRVTGSGGTYGLGLDEVGTAPVFTDVTSPGGTPITYAPRGAVVKLVGSGFGTSFASISIKFSGVWARPISVTDTLVTVKVPQRAVDGDITVFANGRASGSFAFSVGSTAITPPYFDSTPGTTTTTGGITIALDQTLSYFSPDATGAQVASTLDTVKGLDAKRSAWTIVGASPYRSLWQVEWSWTSSPTLTDLQSLLANLRAQSLIQVAMPVTSIRLPSLDLATDHNLIYDAEANQGGYAQIGYEEARRLFRFSGVGTLPSEPAVYVVDDGIMYGSGALWGSNAEDPDTRFSLYEYDGSTFASTADPGHFTSASSYLGAGYCHGNGTAGLIGGLSQSDPPWYDGIERTSTNANGILASLDQFNIDDDGDGTIDDDGESTEFGITVYNAVGEASDDGRPVMYSMWLPDVIEKLASALPSNVVVDFQVQLQRPGWDSFSYWNSAFSTAMLNLCRDRILIFPAGNEGSSEPRQNFIAEVAQQQCPSNVLIVGATHAGGNGSGDDEHASFTAPGESNYGTHVHLLAPGDGMIIPYAHRGMMGGITYGYAAGGGTSVSAPLVASAAALARALTDASTVSGAMIVSYLEAYSDDVSAVYTQTSEPARLNLHRLLSHLLPTSSDPAQYRPPSVYAVDYDDQVLIAQEIDDVETGSLPGSAVTVDISAECSNPVDVEVHPLGDVVYVLCKGNNVIAAYDTTNLELIDTLPLDGTVNAYGQMTIAADGLLYVPTTSGSTHQLESFDTYTGAVHMAAEALHAYTVAATYGAEASPNADFVATSSTANSTASEDYDVLSLVDDDPRATTGYGVTTDDLSATTLTYEMRDIAWRRDGTSVLGVLYGDSGGSDAELYETDFSSVSQVSTIDNCEYPVGISLSAEDYAFVSCQYEDYFAVVDVTSPASNYPLTGYLSWKTSSGTSGAKDPAFSEVSPNGKFLVFGFWDSTVGYVYSVPMSTATAGGAIYSGSYDALGYLFAKPRGIAITPFLSVASPRPGMVVGGVRRLHVVVRDPNVVSLTATLDGATTLCTGSITSTGALGFSDDCLMDTSTWASGWHDVAVEAATATDTYEIHAQYQAR